MKRQNFEERDERIRAAFDRLKREDPSRLQKRLNLSWSNWCFGMETLEASANRLSKHGIEWIELHGNHYGPDLGYRTKDCLDVLNGNGIKVSGICGIFSKDNDLSSNRPIIRQRAIDYIRRELGFAETVGATYMLIVPGAVGRPYAYDSTEFQRSAQTLRQIADSFIKHKVRAGIEPIRADEVSFCHSVAEAKRYIEAIAHPGIQYVNGDVFHMQTSEAHIGEAILDAGKMLVNLHIADSNRLALGEGHLDVDLVIMALYLIGYNKERCFVTPELLGSGIDPYRAMNEVPDPKILDELVAQTVSYFREREKILLSTN